MIYFLSFSVVVIVSALVMDAIPQFNIWQSRIKIGRFPNQHIWNEKVFQTAKKWLHNTPVIPLTDHKRLIIIDKWQGNYDRPAIQVWQESSLVLGLTAYAQKTAAQKTEKEIADFFISKTTAQGGWKIKPTDSDHAILGYALLNADFIDAGKYKAALDETYQMILSLKGEDGTIAYKNHVRQFRFVDTIGFICPFLVKYGVKFNKPEAIQLALHQVFEFVKYGLMPQEKIPCHTYHLHTKIPTGLFGWGRGLGWFLIGLADTYRALPVLHPQKATLKHLIIEVAHSVLKFQLLDGSYTWLIFDEKSRKDSSTVATVAYFLTVAAEIPELKIESNEAKEKCLNYLQKVTRRTGAIDFSQGDTKGIGIYSQNFDILPFTQGFVLRTLNFRPQPQP
ncbi:glycoside hydrolase family 88 protein [Kaistella sp. 97-N-M2]|uniref:glycoside hydrolase family 88 protein n=1 Tax=Kaistella sp. 97-N-M2 TaxID=2908645 RepID=UPI001F3D79D6|nr:glycoside hydrolase family 88 protein [Kaistella sp. 97-N-M2]UJF28775.1 glycoside hydrolase family 88 protein [Kaistella sp. 97-N-M2]